MTGGQPESARCLSAAPESEWAASDMRRDGMGLGQYVGILLDTCYDRRNAGEFVVNPPGGRMDGQITNESGWNQDWNPVWSVRVGRLDGGWTFESVIPFKSLRYRPGRRQIRGINIERRTVWNNEYSALVPLPASWSYLAIMQVSQAATLVNLEVPDPGLNNLNISTYRAETRTARVDVGDDFDDVEVATSSASRTASPAASRCCAAGSTAGRRPA